MATSPKSTLAPEWHPRVHRCAWLFAITVFPLIWLGGLVTSYDAGMAVPDWPGTYGYNLFLYPISSWFFGPWDLFVEHGHRLLASVSGLIAIAMVVVSRHDPRAWFRRLAVIALALVIFQGILGGLRVVLDQRSLAQVHGCVGPTFFITVIALVVASSRWWFEMTARIKNRASTDATGKLGPKNPVLSLHWLSTSLLLAGWVQLLLGASIRHIPESATPTWFRALVISHIALAIGISVGAVVVAFLCQAPRWRALGFGKWGILLFVCVFVQIGLGLTTWVVKFGWPAWFVDYPFAADFVVLEKGFWQMNFVTAHVAVGSLFLAISTAVSLRSWYFQLLSRYPQKTNPSWNDHGSSSITEASFHESYPCPQKL